VSGDGQKVFFGLTHQICGAWAYSTLPLFLEIYMYFLKVTRKFCCLGLIFFVTACISTNRAEVGPERIEVRGRISIQAETSLAIAPIWFEVQEQGGRRFQCFLDKEELNKSGGYAAIALALYGTFNGVPSLGKEVVRLEDCRLVRLGKPREE
jgi:hypothetical protein